MNLDDIYSQMNLLSHAYEESDYEIKYMHKQSDMLRERAGTNKRLHEMIDEREAILVSFQNDCDSKYNEIKSSLIKEKAEQEEEQSSQENENGKNKCEYGCGRAVFECQAPMFLGGSFAPGVGNIVGAVVGFGTGIGLYFLDNSDFDGNGKTLREDVKDSVYCAFMD